MNTSHPGRLPAILLAALLFASACHPAEPPTGQPAAVLKILDGDTIAVEVGGAQENVRLLGVDTPEMNYRTGKPEPFALEATLFTRELVEGTVVRLSADSLNDDRDRYGRLLRYVRLEDGRLLNLELVRSGYGFAYLDFPLGDRERFAEAEAEARRNGSGVWSRIESIPFDRASSLVGRAVAASGTIVESKTVETRFGTRICFLNFHADYRNHLSVVIREDDFKRFQGDPATIYRGRKVTVTGRIRQWRGRLQIQATEPGQITLE